MSVGVGDSAPITTATKASIPASARGRSTNRGMGFGSWVPGPGILRVRHVPV